VVIAATGAAAAALVLPRFGKVRSITGAVLIADPDPRKQLPLPNIEVDADAGEVKASARSDSTGFFRLNLPGGLWWGQAITLRFHDPQQQPQYQPFAISGPLNRRLYIARLKPCLPGAPPPNAEVEEIPLSNLRVRYTIKSTNTIDIGSTARTFEVIHAGNVPCRFHPTCSPDARWEATLGSFHLDAGPGQEFQNARVSCIAGPCAFTRIEKDEFSRGGPQISGTVLVWSDTVTFLVEAEVIRTALSEMIRQSYPSIFGRTMTFTLPPDGEGPSILADVNGTGIVFPLGPALIVSWANCNLQVTTDHSQLYRCALKPGYRFR
jgi:hypothetical protein